jgi:uncharacterized protein
MHNDSSSAENLFAGIRRELDPAMTRRAFRLGGIIGLLLLFAVVLMSAILPYTEYLWYAHDAREPGVFTTAYLARGQLFIASFFVAWIVLYFSLRKALGVSLIYLKRPETYGELMVTSAFDFVQARGQLVIRLASPVIAFLFASTFSREWGSYLLARNAQAFGLNDPLFGLDLGFYVFILPWYRAIANYAFGLLFLTTVLTIGVYAGMQAMAMLARIELSRPKIRGHVSLLIGCTLIVFGLQMWLRRYEFGLMENPQFTGAGFAAIWELRAQALVAILVVLVGVATAIFYQTKRPFQVPIYGGAVAGIAFFLGILVLPSVVQRLWVEPNKLALESPFARRAMDMTRFAYGLQEIEVRQQTVVRDEPAPRELAEAESTLENMRLWDPDILRTSIEGLQGLRPYYTFHDVDVDRYSIDGKQRLVMISPRDVRLDGLSASARTWVNTRLQYTHGFGITMSPVNTATAQGQPTFLVKDMPPQTPPGLELNQPRIYYSHFKDRWGRNEDQYAIVNTKVDEFDYATEDAEMRTYRWTGDRGVPIGGWLSRMAFSFRLGDGNLLVTPNIQGSSRLLMRRNVLERASKVYPFLKLDSDPYIVAYDGRLVWVLDGYTSTDMVPYAQRMGVGPGRLNYIRNSVKIVIDAYSGETKAYAIDPNEPLLRAYRSIYPGLVDEIGSVPAGLERHFRYPEDMFSLQSMALMQYHVRDPEIFLNNSEAWDIPKERGTTNVQSFSRPYYVQMRLPGEPSDEFLLILPFTPREKENMSGWLAARCDPENYGRLVLYKFGVGSLVRGPEQMEAIFNQDPEIADINRQFTNDQSEVVVGNLLVVPIGSSVMYVKPMFLQSRSAGIRARPELKKVILATKDRVEVGNSYAEALTRLFGNQAVRSMGETEAEGPAGESPRSATTEQPQQSARQRAAAREAIDLMNRAEQALREGDFSRYGDLQRKLKDKIQELAQ